MMNLYEKGFDKKLSDDIDALIASDRIPHAVAVCSGSAAQRDEFSRYIAASLVCTEQNRPCGVCRNCLKAVNRSHPDIITVDPEAVNEKTFKIGLVRDMRTDAYILPNEAQHKVYILKSADKMNVQAQNAILKTIEEPPAHSSFILECESMANMLETVVSRVTVFNLGTDEKTFSEEENEQAAELAGRLALALTKPTELEFMRITAVFEKDRDLFPPVLKAMQIIFRDAVAVKAGSNSFMGSDIQTSREIASKISMDSLFQMINDIDSFNEGLARNANKNLIITRFSSVLRNSAMDLHNGG